jgi:hypothetical protein
MKLKILIFVVAYNAEKTIVNLLQRIPKSLAKNYNVSILIIDDCSHDLTQKTAIQCTNNFWCPVTVLKNITNQGYGGNQKLGYHYAIKHKFNTVVLLHGDAQYAPECIPMLVKPFSKKLPPDAVFGSRMLIGKNALSGGMPLYKFIGNKILTKIQNKLLNSHLSEFHSGFRVYSVDTLKKLPIHLNTNDFHFDTEIIVQLFSSNSEVVELPIPTYYGDEKCHVNGMKYAWDVIKSSIKARVIKMGIFYDPKFSFDNTHYSQKINKFSFISADSLAYNKIKKGSNVLMLSKKNTPLKKYLESEKKCIVYDLDPMTNQSIFYNKKIKWGDLDYILLLEVINKKNNLDVFLQSLRKKINAYPKIEIIISAGNICFFITRIMILLGQFNSGRRGILDIEHRNYFSALSLVKFLDYQGFTVLEKNYLPGPYPLAIGLNCFSKFLLNSNNLLAKIMPNLFSYQVLFIIKAKPQISWLIKHGTKKK